MYLYLAVSTNLYSICLSHLLAYLILYCTLAKCFNSKYTTPILVLLWSFGICSFKIEFLFGKYHHNILKNCDVELVKEIWQILLIILSICVLFLSRPTMLVKELCRMLSSDFRKRSESLWMLLCMVYDMYSVHFLIKSFTLCTLLKIQVNSVYKWFIVFQFACVSSFVVKWGYYSTCRVRRRYRDI